MTTVSEQQRAAKAGYTEFGFVYKGDATAAAAAESGAGQHAAPGGEGGRLGIGSVMACGWVVPPDL